MREVWDLFLLLMTFLLYFLSIVGWPATGSTGDIEEKRKKLRSIFSNEKVGHAFVILIALLLYFSSIVRCVCAFAHFEEKKNKTSWRFLSNDVWDKFLILVSHYFPANNLPCLYRVGKLPLSQLRPLSLS